MRKRVIAYIVVLSFVALFSLGFLDIGKITGFAVYEQGNQSEFDLGTYVNTSYNGSDVVLAGSNLTGSYTSKVFDSGSDAGATWNNFTHVSLTPSIEFLYGVDGGGDIYISSDLSITWALKKEGYGRTSDTQEMLSDSSYLYILSNSNKEVWQSTDSGETWIVVNNSFADSGVLAGESDSSENLYAVDASGDVYLSIENGITWTLQGDFNGGATNNAKGFGIDSSGNLYIIDGSNSLFYSSNQGVDWTTKTSDYGGGLAEDLEITSTGELYIIDGSDVWNSTDQGETWTKVNDDFSPYSNDGCKMLIDSSDNIYIADCSGRVFNSTEGIAWTEQGDLNAGASNDIKGLTSFTQNTNISFQVKNCSQSDCSDGSWQTVDISNINLESRYFQYKISFTSPDASITPSLNQVSIDYTILNTAPTLTLTDPSNGASYGYNESLSLNFSASDPDDNIDSCWYILNSNPAIILPSCANTTIDLPEGTNTLSVYVNDSFNLQSNDSATFTVQVGAPSISLSSPINEYLSSQDVTFTYTPTDIDLDSCELWGDFTGSFVLNQTDLGPTSGGENTFALTLEDGVYLWNIRCNDSVANSAFNGNKTFYVDTTNPSLTLTEPSGGKTMRTGIPLTFLSTDASPISCKYNVYQGASTAITNTTIANCTSTTFGVATDGDFVLSLYVNDSAGNLNSTSSSFSVDTSIEGGGPGGGSGSGGGGGGGGGGTVVQPSKPKSEVEIDDLGDIIVKPGESKTLELSVKNIGESYLNKCKLKGSWIESNEMKDIDVGQIVEFIFMLNVPEDASSSTSVSLNCVEISKSVSLNMEFIVPKINVKITEMILESKKELVVKYLVGSEIESIELVFSVYDSEGNLVLEKTGPVGAGEHETVLDVSESENGMLKIIISENGNALVEESFLYDKNAITGFAGFDIGGTGSYIGLIIIVFGILTFFLVRRILRLRKKKKKK